MKTKKEEVFQKLKKENPRLTRFEFDKKYKARSRLRRIIMSNFPKFCFNCRSVKELHVSHIKPVSKFPRLEFDLNNLQILCKDCNFKKSNIDQTDYRSVEVKEIAKKLLESKNIQEQIREIIYLVGFQKLQDKRPTKKKNKFQKVNCGSLKDVKCKPNRISKKRRLKAVNYKKKHSKRISHTEKLFSQIITPSNGKDFMVRKKEAVIFDIIEKAKIEREKGQINKEVSSFARNRGRNKKRTYSLNDKLKYKYIMKDGYLARVKNENYINK